MVTLRYLRKNFIVHPPKTKTMAKQETEVEKKARLDNEAREANANANNNAAADAEKKRDYAKETALRKARKARKTVTKPSPKWVSLLPVIKTMIAGSDDASKAAGFDLLNQMAEAADFDPDNIPEDTDAATEA